MDAAALPLRASWLGRIAYRDAWDLQRAIAAARADGRIDDRLLLLEHPAVLTLGRQADETHVRASARELRRRDIEVIRVERGGEVTYHGPGQLVAYPILGLGDRGLLLRPLVRALEAAMAETCAALGVAGADRREGHPGCWVGVGTPMPRKIGALGLRVERGVSYHGIALNVSTDLTDFDLIDACGMPGVVSTSVAEEVGRTAEPPTTASVGRAAAIFADALAGLLGAPLVGPLPPDADPAAERDELERLLREADAPDRRHRDAAGANALGSDLRPEPVPSAAVQG
jgi:lipoyl(octanoyl) transferase